MMITFVAKRLGSAARADKSVPCAVAFLDELPHTPTHKVAKAVRRTDQISRGKQSICS